MNRIERQVFWRTIGLGLALTLVVICADGIGFLDPIERYLYDFRARYFQVFTPKPTDQIVHLDIDDPALKQIGAFPWPRTRIAEMIDEIKLAGAKVIGMDILFTEPQETRYERIGEGAFAEIQDDQNLADAIKRAENVLIPVSVELLDRGAAAIATPKPARFEEFTLPVPPKAPPMLRAENEVKTVPLLLDAIQYSAAVEFLPDPDGVVRSVPLFVNYRGRLIPHMSLATACAQLGVPIQDLQITATGVTIPIKDAPAIEIPVRTIRSRQYGRIGMFMNVPFFGGSGRGSWKMAFDYPNHVDSKQHISINKVWEICQNRDRLKKNDRNVDQALRYISQLNSSSKLTAFLAKPDDPTRLEMVDSNLKVLKDFADRLENIPTAELMPDDKELLGAYAALKQFAPARTSLLNLIASERKFLQNELNGRFALMGWTATARTDAYPTSLDPLCPGPAIQGMVFNAIMTRRFWRVAPWWLGAISTLTIGAITSFIVAQARTWPAAFMTMAVVGGFLVIDAVILFDLLGQIVPAAAPILAAVLMWFGVTTAKFLYEQKERARITKRFSNYVDPVLVDAIVQNPEAVQFDGQEKEMTVVFTDLEGFTAISERLREKTVPLLNEYMSRMLPFIRDNRGRWNKFLGDGIMFFFNAPDENKDHAADAVRAVLQMERATQKFAQELANRGLPPVAMRAGISTGAMFVGDAGSTDPKHQAADYTVLGDEVNLAARLESANKAVGTRLMVSSRTAEAAGDIILFRPIGSIQVAGKSEGVMTYEALCLASEATDAERKLAALSNEVVQYFRAAKFDECIAAARAINAEFGPNKCSALYISLCEEYLKNPPSDPFNGTIVLSTK